MGAKSGLRWGSSGGDNTPIWEMSHEIVSIEAWGKGGLRVRSTKRSEMLDLPYALLPLAASTQILGLI